MANLPANTNKGIVEKKPAEIPYDHEAEGGFYVTSGKKAPRGTQVQMWANEKDVTLELLDSGKDDKQAWATVRAINNKTNQFVDSRVILIYKQVQDKKMIELAENPYKRDSTGRTKEWMFEDPKNPLLIGENGEIMANLNAKGMIHVKKQMINYIYTAERTAETMAATRAEKKILNREWGDEEEITPEKVEDYLKQEEKENEEDKKEIEKQQEPKRNKVRTFTQNPKGKAKEEENKRKQERIDNEKKEKQRNDEKKPTEAAAGDNRKDEKKDNNREAVTKKEAETKQTQINNKKEFPQTRDRSEYKEVPGKQIVSMIREDLEEADFSPEMKNIAVMLKNLKNEKKISPHQFRVANEYNLEMNF